MAISERCPMCNSSDPKLHPAVQFEGECSICLDPWHDKAAPIGGPIEVIRRLRVELAERKASDKERAAVREMLDTTRRQRDESDKQLAEVKESAERWELAAKEIQKMFYAADAARERAERERDEARNKLAGAEHAISDINAVQEPLLDRLHRVEALVEEFESDPYPCVHCSTGRECATKLKQALASGASVDGGKGGL